MTDIPVKRSFDTSFEAHKGLIHKLARRGYGRLVSVYAAIDYEDVFQEMCLAYVKAAEKFDPEFGVTFTAYLGRAIWNEFNRFAERELDGREEFGLYSLESMDDMLEDDITIMDVIPGDELTPEEIYEAKQSVQENVRLCGPMGKFLISKLMNPGKRVIDAIDSPAWARKRQLTLSFIAKQHDEIDKDLVEVAKRQLTRIYGVRL